MTNDIASEPQFEIKSIPSGLEFEEYHQIRKFSEEAKKPVKRSFDVAFLMLPDEKIKNRSEEICSYPLTELSVRSDLLNHKLASKSDLTARNEHFYETSRSDYLYNKSLSTGKLEISKSAFSKVPQVLSVESPVSPPISPDQLSCSSASPPSSHSPSNHLDYSHLISSSAFQAIDQSSFSSHGSFRNLFYRNNSNHLDSNNFIKNKNDFQHMKNLQFRSSSSHGYQPEHFMRNPAAAILSTLLPTTLGAALSLPAQNVCAKCNISFRMTSDLVFHMRSHHKNENTQDPNRRKREEKLKCPVCSESFRERHHLTRHMTAHQDKEGDLLDHEIAEYHTRKK